ncbi:hypothetical protein RhiirC2_800832 [Rhizophagus irregularis]|uniref:Uncharacterized protein n=1 Tax=Rhizophagus irregularis TaxID=588596 RepID=A0A2N1M345_9GLOM|nr:hypothetical protein RhiirC2_800832 [Rhizophagus irregularis]
MGLLIDFGYSFLVIHFNYEFQYTLVAQKSLPLEGLKTNLVSIITVIPVTYSLVLLVFRPSFGSSQLLGKGTLLRSSMKTPILAHLLISKSKSLINIFTRAPNRSAKFR